MLFFYNSSNNIITGNLGYVLKSIAGIDGEFEMKIPDSLFEEGNVSLTFSFTSYKSKRIIFSKEDFPLSIQIKLVPTALNGIVEKRFEDIENSKRTRIYREEEIVKLFSDGGEFVMGKIALPPSQQDIRTKERELQYKQRENRLDEFIQDYGH